MTDRDAAAHHADDTAGSASQQDADHDHGDGGGGRTYVRFGLMVLTSTVLMFALTYTNAFSVDHARFSEERVYMAALMGSVMALVMLGFMAGMMYRNRRLNAAVVVIALALGGTALYLSRSQALVEDESYMKAMIPHHSIAILTSERAGIEDVRVRELADTIAATQREEIKEMDWLVQDIEENGPATTRAEAESRPVPDFSGSAIRVPGARSQARSCESSGHDGVRDRTTSHREDRPMATGETGFDDVTYDLISVQYHSLKAGHDYGQYVRDAENAGRDDIAGFFRDVMDEDARRAQRCHELLRDLGGTDNTSPQGNTSGDGDPNAS